MPSQRDIARELNLSVATVSRALRGEPGHNPGTTARVIEAATRLGYRLRPSSSARQERASAEMTQFGVMVITGDEERKSGPAVSTRILHGMSDAARELGIALNLTFVLFRERDRIHLRENWPVALRAGHIHGLLLVGEYPAECVQALARVLPCLHVNFHERRVSQDFVGQDHYRSVERLAEYLYEKGHRRIGFIGGGPEFTYARARYAGYVEALAMLGLRFDPAAALNVYAIEPPAQLHAAAAAQIQRGVTAWICVHDQAAYDLAAALLAQGIRVPRDVSLCGFDNLDAPPGLPAITTIDSPFEDIGMAAVRRLANRIRRPSEVPVNITFAGRLVERASVARPRAGR